MAALGFDKKLTGGTWEGKAVSKLVRKKNNMDLISEIKEMTNVENVSDETIHNQVSFISGESYANVKSFYHESLNEQKEKLKNEVLKINWPIIKKK